MATKGRVVTLPDILYSYRYHSSNATLLNGKLAVGENHSQNGHALAAFYMLGAMRLWAGDPPMLLQTMLEKNLCGGILRHLWFWRQHSGVTSTRLL